MKRLALALLVGCGAGETSLPDAGKDASADRAPDVATPEQEASTTTPITVSGEVVDTSGAPWANAKVQVCSSALCTIGSSNGAGAFAVQVPPGNRYHVIARPAPSDAREGSAGLGVLADTLVADTTLAAPIHVPVTGAHASSPAAISHVSRMPLLLQSLLVPAVRSHLSPRPLWLQSGMPPNLISQKSSIPLALQSCPAHTEPVPP